MCEPSCCVRRLVLSASALLPLSTVTAQQKIPDFSADRDRRLARRRKRVHFRCPRDHIRSRPTRRIPMCGTAAAQQPTLRVADLDNPILQPWVKEALRKVNERMLAGKGDNFPPQVRCWPLGVPAFRAVSRRNRSISCRRPRKC